MTSSQASFAVQSVIGVSDLLMAVRAMGTVRANEIDGEESDGTPRSWRNRPFVSLTQIERLLEARKTEAPTPLDDKALQQLFGEAIEAALTSGAKGIDEPPVGHWLARFWSLGRAQSTAAAASPVALTRVGQAAMADASDAAGQDDLCDRCNGSGEQDYLVGGGPDAYDQTGPCGKCSGTGAMSAQHAETPGEPKSQAGQGAATPAHFIPAQSPIVAVLRGMLPMLRRDYLALASKYACTPYESDAAYQEVKKRYEEAKAVVENADAGKDAPAATQEAASSNEFKEIVEDLVYQNCFSHLKPEFQDRVREAIQAAS